jgi:ankyrin repeat protein
MHRREIENYSPLCILAHRGNFSAFKALQDSKPPLFKATDVGTKYLIHHAARSNEVEMMKMLIDINPAAIYNPNQE